MRKRSNYKPKGVRPDALAYVLSGLRSFSDVPNAITIRIKNHDALDKLRQGTADRDVIDILIAAYNMAEALVRQGIGVEYSAEIRAGQDALLAVARRERFILKAEELNALNLAMEVHDAQLDVCTVVNLEKALDLVRSCIIHKRARIIK